MSKTNEYDGWEIKVEPGPEIPCKIDIDPKGILDSKIKVELDKKTQDLLERLLCAIGRLADNLEDFIAILEEREENDDKSRDV